MQNIAFTKKASFSKKQRFFGLVLAALACGAMVESVCVEAAKAGATVQHMMKFDKAAVQVKAKMSKKLQEVLSAKMQVIEVDMKKETEELQKDASLMQNFNEKQKASFEARHKAFRERVERMQLMLMSVKDLIEKETNDNARESVRTVVKDVAQKNGLDEASIVVLESVAIAYSGDGVMDITDLVIEDLDKKHPGISDNLEKKIKEIGVDKK